VSTLTPSSDVAGRAAHELGLAAMLGGNLFGPRAAAVSWENVRPSPLWRWG
jgi:hypothetical protein